MTPITDPAKIAEIEARIAAQPPAIPELAAKIQEILSMASQHMPIILVSTPTCGQYEGIRNCGALLTSLYHEHELIFSITLTTDGYFSARSSSSHLPPMVRATAASVEAYLRAAAEIVLLDFQPITV
jgi:hypothetical protein